MAERPACIGNFRELLEPTPPWSRGTDLEGEIARLGRTLGLSRIGVNYQIVPPGHRTSLPHAHDREEELVLVVSGTPDLWLDGTLHRLEPGDAVAFPPGTGIAHTFLNNRDEAVHLLIVGDANAADALGDRVSYPLNPEMRAHPRFWHDAPERALEAHDAKPKRTGELSVCRCRQEKRRGRRCRTE